MSKHLSIALVLLLSFSINKAFAGSAPTRSELEAVLEKYDHLDPNHVVPTAALERLVAYYDQVKDKLGNPNYITVIDFSKHSSQKRMHVIDMKTGAVVSYLAAHGKGSEGARDDGYADRFSNVDGSNASSLGIYKTGEPYSGAHGLSLRLHGLEATNSNAYSRAIVLHGADYVSPGTISSTGRIGRSLGCPAVENRYAPGLVASLKNGSLMIAWTNR